MIEQPSETAPLQSESGVAERVSERSEADAVVRSTGPTSVSGGDDWLYRDGLYHLADELVLVRALLRRHLVSLSALRARPEGPFSGLAIGADEIERFLEGVSADPDPEDEAFIAALRTRIDARIQRARSGGIRLPFPELVESFGLSEVEARVLLVLLAPELEPAFERAYAFAWNDFTRRTADVGFVLAMIFAGFRDRCEAALLFSPTEPLRWNGLVDLESAASPTQRGFLARPVRLAPRVVGFLLGDPTPDEAIHPYLRVITPKSTRAEFILQRDDFDTAWRGLEVAVDAGGARACLRGAPGAGKKLLAEAFLETRGIPMLVVDLEALAATPQLVEDGLRAARRESLLRRAVIYLDCAAFENPDDIGRRIELVVAHVFRDFPGLVPIGGTFMTPLFGGARGGVSEILLPLPEVKERETLWERAIGRGARLAPGTRLDEIARQYPLTGGAIIGAARGAQVRARRRSPDRPVVRRADLIDSARQQLTGRLATLATRIATSLSWDDLVLPEEGLGRLKELIAFAKHRKKVFEDWGFGALVPYGRGLSTLFHGPPGTGKTMVAGIIAGELGMDLFRVDLSQIVSKYVGETEKNLARIFDEAGQSHSVLLFDEADSLFAKRTEVKSATDRYANLEVNFLLQRMEDFDGVTVLTTNFESGIDDAFKRRLRFRIEFPFPQAKDREALWRKMVPAAAKIDRDIHWDELASDYELTGGHIKNTILRAAFIAAERDTNITHEDLRVAAAQECKEIGRLVRATAPDDAWEESES